MMNWEALGVIAELIGATAVVLSLGYLAIQIKRGGSGNSVVYISLLSIVKLGLDNFKVKIQILVIIHQSSRNKIECRHD